MTPDDEALLNEHLTRISAQVTAQGFVVTMLFAHHLKTTDDPVAASDLMIDGFLRQTQEILPGSGFGLHVSEALMSLTQRAVRHALSLRSKE